MDGRGFTHFYFVSKESDDIGSMAQALRPVFNEESCLRRDLPSLAGGNHTNGVLPASCLVVKIDGGIVAAPVLRFDLCER